MGNNATTNISPLWQPVGQCLLRCQNVTGNITGGSNATFSGTTGGIYLTYSMAIFALLFIISSLF